MVKEKRILSYFIGWLILGFCIIFIGINNVFASEIIISPTAKFYDNSGSSVSSVETEFENNRYLATFTTATDSYGALVTFQLNTTLQKGRIYTIFILAGAESNGGQTRPSSKKSIGIGSNFNNANNSYINSNNETSYSASSGTTAENSRGVYYTFIANETGSYISVPYTTQYTCSNCRQYFNGYTLEDLGSSENLSQDEVNDIINSQTTIIQNNINEIQQSILNNQNENNEKLIEELKKGQLTCGYNYKEEFKYSNLQNQGAIAGGVIENNSNFKYSEPTIIFGGYKYDVSGYNTGTSNRYLIAVYDSEMNYLFDFNYKNNSLLDLSTYEGILYIVANVNASEVNDLVIVQKNGICVPTSYLQMKQNQETNDKLDGIQGSITDSSSPNTSGLENSAGWLPPGPLDSILNLPLTMLNSLTNSLGKTCSPLNLTLPYVNKNIQIPCLSAIFAQITGVNGLWSWVGTIASVLILYNYLLNLYAWVDRVLTLRAEFDEAMGADLANWGRL